MNEYIVVNKDDKSPPRPATLVEVEDINDNRHLCVVLDYSDMMNADILGDDEDDFIAASLTNGEYFYLSVGGEDWRVLDLVEPIKVKYRSDYE